MNSTKKSNKVLALLAAVQALKANPSQFDVPELARLPLGQVKFNPSEDFRLAVYKLAMITKMSPYKAFELLLEIAAGLTVQPLQVCPKNGPETGVSLELVSKALQLVADYVRIFECKETLAIDKVQAMRNGQLACIELQIAVRKLCAETFYSHETLLMMQAFARKNIDAIKGDQADIEKLEKSVPEGSDKQKHANDLAKKKSNLEMHQELAKILVRLGFSPEFSV